MKVIIDESSSIDAGLLKKGLLPGTDVIDLRNRAAAMREEVAKQTDVEARALGLGRRVTIGDVAKFHKSAHKCQCHGNVEMTIIRQINGEQVKQLLICGRAMKEIEKSCGWRLVNTPDGPRWYIGVEPENFPFWVIYMAERREWLWREQWRAKLNLYPSA